MEHISECAYYKFIKRRVDHSIMFGWVSGQRRALPSVSITKAIESYLNHFNINDDVQTLEACYHRMIKELIEAEKS